MWDFLTSDAGTAVWLGAGVQRLDEPGAAYETEAGTAGEIRSFRPARPGAADLAARGLGSRQHGPVHGHARRPVTGRGCVFHQERLADAAERVQQRTHWQGVMDALVAALENR